MMFLSNAIDYCSPQYNFDYNNCIYENNRYLQSTNKSLNNNHSSQTVQQINMFRNFIPNYSNVDYNVNMDKFNTKITASNLNSINKCSSSSSNHHNNKLLLSNNKSQQTGATQHSTVPQNRLRKISLGSGVAIHKLRDSKWFTHDEEKVFCAVIESGFIVELRDTKELDEQNVNSNVEQSHFENLTNNMVVSMENIKEMFKSSSQADNDTNTCLSHWGIAMWQPGQEKSKSSDNLQIYHLQKEPIQKASGTGGVGKYRLRCDKLKDIWLDGVSIRINNRGDKDQPANSEAVMRHMIEMVNKYKHLKKWQDDYDFVKWLRYDQVPQITKAKKIADFLRLRHIGLTSTLLFNGHNRKSSC